MQASWGYAAGNVIGSAEDMLRFWHALMTSQLLSKQQTALLFERLYPMFDDGLFYGRGVMLYAFANQTWLGHSGGVSGAKAIVVYAPSQQSFVAVALSGDGSVNLLLQQL